MSVYRVKKGTKLRVIERGKTASLPSRAVRDLIFEESELPKPYSAKKENVFHRAGAKIVVAGRDVEKLARRPKVPDTFIVLHPSRVDGI
jgi:hypothetical protein